ncbi:hypothetical protein ACPV4X_27090, partial [Vibrio owensii]|uniref:hypothetical protein n=1 Tax=Vibrio owensii TaxID=696485 RepID=UPI00406972EB
GLKVDGGAGSDTLAIVSDGRITTLNCYDKFNTLRTDLSYLTELITYAKNIENIHFSIASEHESNAIFFSSKHYKDIENTDNKLSYHLDLKNTKGGKFTFFGSNFDEMVQLSNVTWNDIDTLDGGN